MQQFEFDANERYRQNAGRIRDSRFANSKELNMDVAIKDRRDKMLSSTFFNSRDPKELSGLHGRMQLKLTRTGGALADYKPSLNLVQFDQTLQNNQSQNNVKSNTPILNKLQTFLAKHKENEIASKAKLSTIYAMNKSPEYASKAKQMNEVQNIASSVVSNAIKQGMMNTITKTNGKKALSNLLTSDDALYESPNRTQGRFAQTASQLFANFSTPTELHEQPTAKAIQKTHYAPSITVDGTPKQNPGSFEVNRKTSSAGSGAGAGADIKPPKARRSNRRHELDIPQDAVAPTIGRSLRSQTKQSFASPTPTSKDRSSSIRLSPLKSFQQKNKNLLGKR